MAYGAKAPLASKANQVDSHPTKPASEPRHFLPVRAVANSSSSWKTVVRLLGAILLELR